MTNEPAGQRPPIHMIEAEADALWDIALAARAQHPATAALLLQEIERADMPRPETIPARTRSSPSSTQTLLSTPLAGGIGL